MVPFFKLWQVIARRDEFTHAPVISCAIARRAKPALLAR